MSFFSSTVTVGAARSSARLAKARWTHVPQVVPALPAVNRVIKATAVPPLMARSSRRLPEAVVARTQLCPVMSRGYASPVAKPQPQPTRPILRRASPSQTIQHVSRAVPAAAAPKSTRPRSAAVLRPAPRRREGARFHPHLAPIAESGSVGAPARPPLPSPSIQLREEAVSVVLPAPGRRRSAVARFHPHLAPISESVAGRPALRRAAPYHGQSHPAQL